MNNNHNNNYGMNNSREATIKNDNGSIPINNTGYNSEMPQNNSLNSNIDMQASNNDVINQNNNMNGNFNSNSYMSDNNINNGMYQTSNNVEMNNQYDQNNFNINTNSKMGDISYLTSEMPINDDSLSYIAPEKKSKKSIIKTVILSAIIILIIVLLGYRFYFNNPYNLMINMFDGISSKYEETIENIFFEYDLNNDVIYAENEIVIDVLKDDAELLGMFDGINGYLKIGYDYKNEKMTLNTSIGESNINYINGEVQIEQEEVYLNLKDLFSKTILINLEEELDDSQLFDKDLDYSVDTIKKIVPIIVDGYKETLDKGNKEVEKIEIDYFGDKKNVTKTTFIYDKNSYDRLIKYIKSSDELIDLLSTVLELSKDDIIKYIDEGYFVEYIEGQYNFSVYTSGILNNCVGMAIGSETQIEYLIKGNEAELRVNDIDSNEEIIVEINNEKKSTTFNIELDNSNFSGTISDKSVEIVLEDESIQLTLNLEITKKTEDYIMQNHSLNIKYYEGEDEIEIQVNLENKIEKVNNLSDIEKTEVININDLTQDDVKDILSNLINNIEGSALSMIINEDTFSSLLVDPKETYIKEIEEITQALELKIIEDENQGIEKDCYTISEIIMAANMDYSAYNVGGKILVDRSSSSYRYNLYTYDYINDLYLANYTYFKGRVINPLFISEGIHNISVTEFTSCN